MMAASDVWTRTLETWQGMIPPLANPSVVDPWQAARITLGIQRAAIETWRDSCVQACELGTRAVDWTAGSVEQLAQAQGEQGR